MFRKKQGITLIALIITIIILLILAGIGIATLTGDNGLFTRAQQAKEKTQESQEKENETIENYIAQIDEISDENTLVNKVKSGEIKIGDYVKYNIDVSRQQNIDDLIELLEKYSGTSYNVPESLKQENLNWRILDVKDGKVRIINDTPTISKIFLNGYNGYNNGVFLIDTVCSKLYSSELSYDVKSIKIEDIQEKMKTDYKNIDSDYDKTYPMSKDFKYPSILAEERGQVVNDIIGNKYGLSNQDKIVEQTEINTATSLKIKKTYWRKLMEKEDFYDPIYYEIFMNKNNENYNSYWISSRCIDLNMEKNSAVFGIRFIYAGEVCTNGLYYTTGYSQTIKPSLRPVITLKDDTIVDIKNSGDGSSAENAYVLK